MIGLVLKAGMPAETGIGALRKLLARLTMSGPEGILLQKVESCICPNFW